MNPERLLLAVPRGGGCHRPDPPRVVRRHRLSEGPSGPTIPREGRIAAIADVFDALTSDKVFRKAYPIGKAVEMMKEGRGTQFDPELLDDSSTRSMKPWASTKSSPNPHGIS